jgi:hypothetical protein
MEVGVVILVVVLGAVLRVVALMVEVGVVILVVVLVAVGAVVEVIVGVEIVEVVILVVEEDNIPNRAIIFVKNIEYICKMPFFILLLYEKRQFFKK